MKKWLAAMALSFLTTGVWAEEPLIDLASEIEPEAVEPTAGLVGSKPAPKARLNDLGASDASQEMSVKATQSSLPPVLREPAIWGYTDKIAPRYWGHLDARYATCVTGKSQSPINLTENQAVHTSGLPSLDISYRDVPLRLIHSDHGLRGNYPLGSFIRLGEQRFELTHYQFHTPSEHHLEGFAYPMEIQLVHRDGEGRHVIMSVIVQEGETNDALTGILNNLPTEKDALQVFERVNFNPVGFLPTDKRFFRYVGSMTTPPCNEGVVWLVFKTPIQASIGQLVKMNELMGENVRPLQGLNGRVPMKSWTLNTGANHPAQMSPGYYFDY